MFSLAASDSEAVLQALTKVFQMLPEEANNTHTRSCVHTHTRLVIAPVLSLLLPVSLQILVLGPLNGE